MFVRVGSKTVINSRAFSRARALTVILALMGSGVQAQVVTLGLLRPASGPLQKEGAALEQAVTLALGAETNLKARGVTVRLKTFDENLNERVLGQQVRDSGALAVVGGLSREKTNSVSELLGPSKIAFISPSSTDPVFTSRGLSNTFRVLAREDEQGKAAARYLLGLNVKTVLTLDDSSSYGKTLITNLNRYLGSKVEVVAALSVSSVGDLELTVKAIKNLKPDVLYYGGGPTLALPLYQRLEQAKLGVPFMGGNALSNPTFFKNLGQGTREFYFTDTLAPLAAYPRAKSFLERFKRQYKAEPNGVALNAYDAVSIVLSALNQLSGDGVALTRASLSSALHTLDFPDQLSGDLSFNPLGDRKKAPVYLLSLGLDMRPRVSQIFTTD